MKYKKGQKVLIEAEIIGRGFFSGRYKINIAKGLSSIFVEEKYIQPALEFTWGEEVYVSNFSEEDALIRKNKCKFIGINSSSFRFVVISLNGDVLRWRFCVKIPKEETKPVTLELTDEQLELIKKQFNI